MAAASPPLPVPQRIEFDNLPAVLAELVAACERIAPTGPVTLDLAGLADFDSSAVSLLLELTRRRAAPLTVLNPPPKLAGLAELYGVADLLFGRAATAAGQ